MSVLTPAEFREHQATDLAEAALQRLIDAAEWAIDQRHGAIAQVSERRRGGGTLLFLSRPAGAIGSITEVGSTTALAANDYVLSPDGLALRRTTTGPRPAELWAPWVDAVYTPRDDQADRIRATVALVALDLNHNPGLSAEAIGDWNQTYANNSVMHYGLEREAILASLGAGGLGFA